MDYVTTVNSFLLKELAKHNTSVVYGQNINAGSRLGGFSKGLDSIDGCEVINTPNVENSLVGMGFGLMLKNVPSVFMMKQQDFLLLGVDQLVNTWNALKSRGSFAPFVIAMIVVDNGWEGPQSSYNNLHGLGSLTGIETFNINGEHCIEPAMLKAFSGGPKILAVSQKMFKMGPTETTDEFIIEMKSNYVSYSKTQFKSKKIVIISFNFSFPEALEIAKEAICKGLSVTLIVSYTRTLNLDFDEIQSCQKANQIFIIEDTKNSIKQYSNFYFSSPLMNQPSNVHITIREDERNWHFPQADSLSISNAIDLINRIY
jgi:pyruvate dehydrogenase E1 component beta subunit